MGADTGIGLPGAQTTSGSDLSGLSDDQIPVFRNSRLENSGFRINSMTRALQGATNIETLADIQSGVSTWRLGFAHSVSSAAENVTFRNTVNNVVFHPTWQTTEAEGDWSSVQRTPIGDLVEDFVFQADRSETVTNPDFMFTSLPFNHRLYEIQVEPIEATENIIVVLQQDVNGEFIDYWRSRLINLTPSDLANPTPQNIAINPFVDLIASTQYRIQVGSATDVVLRGNSAGLPRITLTYRRWTDLPLATEQFVGGYRLDDSIEISDDVTITADNVAQYDNKLWIIIGPPGTKTITVSDNLDFTYFGVFVRGGQSVVVIQQAAGGTITFNDRARVTFTNRQATIFARVAAHRFFEISNNAEGLTAADGVVIGATVTGNTLTLDRSGELPDLTVNLPVQAPSDASTIWTVQSTILLPISTTSRIWYNLRRASNSMLRLPAPSAVIAGWHTFIANDSLNAIITINGDFVGPLESVSLMPGQGVQIVFDGSEFTTGPMRQSIQQSNAEPWEGNPLLANTSYTNSETSEEWNSGTALNLWSNTIADTHLRNHYIVVGITAAYTITLPGLTPDNFGTIPIGDGFTFAHAGSGVLSLAPDGNDVINFRASQRSGAILVNGGSVLRIVRLNDNEWNLLDYAGSVF